MSSVSVKYAELLDRTAETNIYAIQIKEYTGCTYYDIRQAKLAAKGCFADLKVPFHRVRINRPILKEFVGFISL